MSRPQHDLDPADGLLAQAVVDPGAWSEAAVRSRRRRARQRIAALVVALLAFAAVAGIVAQVARTDTSGSASPAPKVAVTGEAVGVLLLRPGQDPVRLAAARPVVGVAASERAASPQWQLDGVASVQGATSAARVAVGRRSALATAGAASIELLGGRVKLTDASLTASAVAQDGRASGGIDLSSGARLEIDGARRELGVNERIAVDGVGTVIVNEQAVVANAPSGDAQTGPRYRTVGALVHLRVTQPSFGLPAGSELVIGRVDAGVRVGKVRAVEHPRPGAVDRPPLPAALATAPSLQPGAPRPGESSLPRRSTGVRANASIAPGTGLTGYLFPVLGTSNFSNDWGAPRASTGIPHQGTDIFAEEGTPIVAVADGVLDRVGWNSIGGYRFWLFDEQGNSFYHAHLSAYSPLAVDGARVRRGDVIGFVGHTGDAQYTPPHLHFEVHPGNGAAVNPFPFLSAWKRGVAVAIGLVAGGVERVAPLALLNFTDISANSGLRGDVVSRVPDTHARPVDHENAPRPTDESLTGAIEGPATTSRD